MKGYGLSRERFALLFAVMLVAAAGNTAMQSLMPTMGRALGIPDIWIALSFSLSATIWVATAPHWARMSDSRGRRALMRLGLYGFIISMLICAGALLLGLQGLIASTWVFAIFVFGRAVYGAYGSAAPPAVQAYVAARTDRRQRTAAIAGIASSFSLGTVFGPALAPLFIFEPLGLSGPLFVFAAVGAAVLVALVTRLPDDTPRNRARGPIVSEPSIGGAGSDPVTLTDERSDKALAWRDPRIVTWNLIGLIGGQGNAALLGVIGFLVLDRLKLPPDQAQQGIALVLMAGAGATLLAQWGLIPRLGLDPRMLILSGSPIAALGSVVTGLSTSVYGITTGFALASLGFGFFRPGFTSGASLAVERNEQNAIAGMATSVNGAAFITGPAMGVLLYQIAIPLPFIVAGVLMLGLAVWVSLSFRPSGPAE